MAATAIGARLTEAHRLAQSRLGASTVAQLLDAWPLLSAADIDGTTPRWLRVAVALVQRQRQQSASLAFNYLRTFRAIEAGTLAGIPSIPITAGDPTVIATSLTVTGPVKAKQAIGAGRFTDVAMRDASTTAARAGMRQAMAGGREQITQTVREDRRAQGWARTTSGNACAFCAMLSSRGPAYSQEAVDFEAHDGCSCSAEPVYRDDAAWPVSAQRNRELYSEAQEQAEAGTDQLNALRQHLSRN